MGFQCPECVRTGARETRSGRTPYGGRRSGDAGLTSKVLIGVNVGIFGLLLATGGAASRWVDVLALRPLGLCVDPGAHHYFPHVGEGVCRRAGERWLEGVSSGAVWQPLSSAFTHVAIWHIAFNMLALWFLGPQLELALGRARFLALYLLSALSGSACVMWLSDPASSTLGASGAIFGLMGALLVVAWKVRADLTQLLGWIGVNFLITVLGSSFISWQGHLGGFIGGLIIMGVLAYAPRERRALWQWLGMGLIGAILVAVIAVRAAALG